MSFKTEATPAVSTSTASISPRLPSLDQLRGYTVAGMILVNFLGQFSRVHPVLKHNDTYFSYADSIMPGFLFAVGVSFRLSCLRRQTQSWHDRLKIFGSRSLALVVLSLVLNGFGFGFSAWADFDQVPDEFLTARISVSRTQTPATWETTSAIYRKAVECCQEWDRLTPLSHLGIHFRIGFATTLKSHLWETLAIIGVTQLLVLQWILQSMSIRWLVLVGYALLHCGLSYAFNWDFVYGINDTALSRFLMTGDNRSWDGGLFGPISWAIPLLAGTLACDMMLKPDALKRMLISGCAFMLIGYGLSCLSTLYQRTGDEQALDQQARKADDLLRKRIRNEIQVLDLSPEGSYLSPPLLQKVIRQCQRTLPNRDLATSPVWPPFERYQGVRTFLAEPPFVPPPQDSEQQELRPLNYWMMGKRMPNLSFMLFATGFALVLLAGFVQVCDRWGFTLGLFRTFGTNALAVYCIHYVVYHALKPTLPKDSELWYIAIGFALFFGLTYLCVRYLEKNRLYIKL